jgi:hypothetical protein
MFPMHGTGPIPDIYFDVATVRRPQGRWKAASVPYKWAEINCSSPVRHEPMTTMGISGPMGAFDVRRQFGDHRNRTEQVAQDGCRPRNPAGPLGVPDSLEPPQLIGRRLIAQRRDRAGPRPHAPSPRGRRPEAGPTPPAANPRPPSAPVTLASPTGVTGADGPEGLATGRAGGRPSPSRPARSRHRRRHTDRLLPRGGRLCGTTVTAHSPESS